MTNLMRFLAPYKKSIIVMIILLLIQVGGTLYIPTLTANIVNIGIVTGDLDYVWKTGGIMLLVAFVTAGISVLGTYISTSVSAGLGQGIRGALFRKVQSFSISDFNRFGTASMITRSTNDVQQVQQAFSVLVEMLLPAPFMAVSGLILAFSKNRFLAFIILGLMLLVLIVAVKFVKKVTPMFEKLQTLMDRINRTVRENIIGVRVIRAFNRTRQEKVKADESFQEYAETSIGVNKLFAAMLPMVMAVMNLCTLLILWFGGKQVASGEMQIGDIMAIIEYAILILMYLIMGVAVFAIIPRARICLTRINNVLDLEPEFSDTPANSGDFKQSAMVKFDNVTFQYNNAEESVLQNISFEAQKGQTTAIIGGTGSGKSTISNLLIRLYDIQEGSILIKGKDIREYPQQELRAMIGYVPQKAFLFSGTIADNLRHGRKNATAEEMLCAAKIAQLDDFIMGAEKGLDSHVAQGGSNLSGGQKQRLSIARAIIKNPDIFIFDDSFSALDFKTDRKLRAALKSEISNSAMIIVAQRISTITDADQIIVLDEGRIVGQGTHKELLRNCQVYQQIARSQLSEEELA